MVRYYVEEARRFEDYSHVSSIGVDETSAKKGHDYVTFVVDLEKKKTTLVTKEKSIEGNFPKAEITFDKFHIMKILGKAGVAELVLTGKMISAPEALAIGLVNQVVPSENSCLNAGYWLKTSSKKVPLPLNMRFAP